MDNKFENMINNKCLKKTLISMAVIISLFLVVKIANDMKEYKYIGDNTVRNSITVSGKAEKYEKPDTANISFSVTSENMDVSKATDIVNKKIVEIIASLKVNGVSEKDIKTADYSIYPRYDYVKDIDYYSGKQVLAGYTVTQNINLKITNLSKTGKIITDLGNLKVSNMSGLTFTNDKYDEIVKEVREDAIKDAREEAKKLANSLGVKLGKIISFSDNNNNNPIYYSRDMMKSPSMAGGSAEAVIPIGENKIVSNVSITYEIK